MEAMNHSMNYIDKELSFRLEEKRKKKSKFLKKW